MSLSGEPSVSAPMIAGLVYEIGACNRRCVGGAVAGVARGRAIRLKSFIQQALTTV